MKKIIFLISILFFLNFISAETYSDCNIYGNCQPVSKISYISYINNTNSSDFWDSLDTPTDITYDEISGGDVNANGYTGYFSYLFGTVGGLDINGNPWYLGNASLELDEELQVNGDSNLNNTYPQQTLSSSLGSGALRWLWLYVQNISAENIDTYTVHASENITTDAFFVGNGSYLTGITVVEQDLAWNGNYTTFTGLINNASYLSTYNATYDAKVSFNNTNLAWTNQTNKFSQNQNLTNKNLTDVDCIFFKSGGKICAG